MVSVLSAFAYTGEKREKGGSAMIYLLEDDDSIRKLVIYTLQSQGYELATLDKLEKY